MINTLNIRSTVCHLVIHGFGFCFKHSGDNPRIEAKTTTRHGPGAFETAWPSATAINACIFKGEVNTIEYDCPRQCCNQLGCFWYHKIPNRLWKINRQTSSNVHPDEACQHTA